MIILYPITLLPNILIILLTSKLMSFTKMVRQIGQDVDFTNIEDTYRFVYYICSTN